MAYILIILIISIITEMDCNVRVQNLRLSFTLYSNQVNITNITDFNMDLVNFGEKSVFIVHGWMDNGQAPHYKELANAFITKGGYNVFVVDWSELANALYFTQATLDTKVVGKHLGNLITKLNMKGYPLSEIHIVGHSLGAHIAGFAGQRVKLRLKNKIGRITGLDPAAPRFSHLLDQPDEMLSADDAEIVDVLHTAGGTLGILEAIGTVDFYANWGIGPQPNCQPPYYVDVFIPAYYGCSHMSALQYFTEAIHSNKFVGSRCEVFLYLFLLCRDDEKLIYGLEMSKNSSGIYYFDTNPIPPFGKGKQFEIKLQ